MTELFKYGWNVVHSTAEMNEFDESMFLEAVRLNYLEIAQRISEMHNIPMQTYKNALSFCRDCMSKWWNKNRNCPMCRTFINFFVNRPPTEFKVTKG